MPGGNRTVRTKQLCTTQLSAMISGMGATDRMLCFALYSAMRKTARTYKELLEPWGLTYPQYLVLYVLWNHGPQTVRALGEELELDSGTVSPVVKRLEQADYVTRRRSSDDERVVTVELTASGDELRQSLAGIPREVAAAMGVPDDDSARALIHMLRQLGCQDDAPTTNTTLRKD